MKWLGFGIFRDASQKLKTDTGQVIYKKGGFLAIMAAIKQVRLQVDINGSRSI